MTLVQAVALGVLQGVTEFLPISSSGHLALAQTLLGRNPEAALLFSVVLHLGTTAAILWVLRARVGRLVGALYSLRRPSALDPGLATERRWLGLIVVASIPTGLAGLGLRHFVEDMSQRPVWIGLAFLLTMALLLSAERIGARRRGAEALTALDALCVGCAQSVGILPGVSRSGSTITVALWRDATPEVAVEFSILISVPAILGANLLELLSGGAQATAGALALGVGFTASLLTGVAALHALVWVVRERRLTGFALYCGVLGLGAILVG
ncbi:MAG: undecaprenyl-diphosphate phosphatase [Myxococcota bacterium]